MNTSKNESSAVNRNQCAMYPDMAVNAPK
jgi:hypothetical protein